MFGLVTAPPSSLGGKASCAISPTTTTSSERSLTKTAIPATNAIAQGITELTGVPAWLRLAGLYRRHRRTFRAGVDQAVKALIP